MSDPRGSEREALSALVAGGRFGRRTMLRLSAGVALGLPAALAACGKTTAVDRHRYDYIVDLVATSLQIGDLARLMAARARERSMQPTLKAYDATGLPAALGTQIALGVFDAQSNTTPPAFALLVVPAVNLVHVQPILATAVQRGIKIVAYPAPIARQSAAILVDEAQGATMLATHAAAWARARLSGRGRVLLVLPIADEVRRNPYAADAAGIERAMRSTLARAAPGLTVTATDAISMQHALAAHPDVRIALVWRDDYTAGVTQALHAHRARGSAAGEDLYVGALCSPAVTSRATFSALQRDDVLRAVVAVRVRDLANAMVDLPHAVLRGDPAPDVRLAFELLTPRSPQLAEYGKDYAKHPQVPDLEIPLNQVDPSDRHDIAP